MKKFVALLLAVLLVMVNIAVLAEDEQGPVVPAIVRSAAPASPSFTKTYDAGNASVFPVEELEFTVTPNAKNPDTEKLITVGNGNKFTPTATTNTIAVNLPTYMTPGEYVYTVKEKAGSTQGVTYDETEITVKVYVVYDTSTAGDLTDVKVLGTNVYTKIENDVKKDEIKNTYKVGDMTLTKTVSGNLADFTKAFTIEVAFTSTNPVLSDIAFEAPTGSTVMDGETTLTTGKVPHGTGWTTKTVSVTLKDQETITFSDIPVGVTYTVTETKVGDKAINKIAADNSTQVANANDPTAYNVTETAGNAISDEETSVATVANVKNVEVPTGITLETLPYVLIMAIAMVGAVALFARKREEN